MQPKMTSSQFFEAARNGKLVGVQCTKCGQVTCPPRMVCQECGTPEGDLVEMSRKGVIRTYTVTNVAPSCFKAPYVLALVEADEGPWLMGNITGLPPEKISDELMGKRVQIDFMEVDGDMYSDGKGIALSFVPLA